ncbi:MAG: CDP-alcohol phosphatidyltransferase family protein [Longimicrobiales bacterium]|nr:CDP-alcohol phosphatidyltransferase family protein [Longimicrobiales bacterium]
MRGDMLVLGSVVGFALASMVAYALAARGEDDPHEIADRGDFLLGDFVRSWFLWFVGPVVRAAVLVRLSPTVFNVLGVLCGVGAGISFATGRTNLGGWLVLAGGAADVLDGRVARSTGRADDTGAFLDSTLDRFAEVGAFVGLAVMYRASAVAVAVVATALGGSLLVSYARARGESLGVVAKVGVMQRAERLLILGFGGILDPAVTSWLGWTPGAGLLTLIGLMAAGTVGTALYRTVWIARRLDAGDEAG